MSTFRIADLSIGNASTDCSYEYDYNGHHFDVQRFGANFSVPYFKSMIMSLRNQVDAFAISDMPRVMRIRDNSYVHRQYLEIMATPSSVPLCDGGQLKELATVNALSKMIEKGELKPEQGIFFPLALLHLEAVYALEAYREYLGFGDSYSVFGIPWLAKPSKFTSVAAQALIHLASLRDIKNQTPVAKNPIRKMTRASLLQQVRKYQYIFCDVGPLVLFGDDLGFIRGKDVIITQNHLMEDDLRKYNPRSIINLFPEKLKLNKHINYAVLDATLRLAENKTAPLSLEEWQQLLSVNSTISDHTRRHVMGSRPTPQFKLTSFVQKKRIHLRKQVTPDFAFVVHPLSRDHLFKAPGLGSLKNIPLDWKKGLENLASKAPGFTYGYINHVISKKTGREVNGIIYAILSTPKLMRQEEPEFIYRKIEALCHHSAELGAKIIGLGAYTKVIGDSGETINRNSPIPVTTGNSLSASATLWAVYDVVKRMNLLKPVLGTELVDGTATVIGATGSIGSVSAKLLGLTFKKLCLVAPRIERLEELALEIRKMNPRCEVLVSVNSNDFARETDVLVTATSALDSKIIDIELLKPGCVICDCSRPLDFSPEDAAKRPDILIIESGEVVLPGPVKMSCDLGLPDDSVYACLGETVLLALEGLYEPFTLGRNIDYQKVKRIYKMAQDHGVKLAAIRGHLGFISDREIELTKRLALSKLGKIKI